jgi:hypothetical protein
MRNLLVLSAAASVLALGVSIQQAGALIPGATATGSSAFVQKVQQKGEEKGTAGAQGKDTGARTGGAAQSQGDKGGQVRSGEARGGQRRSTNVDANVDRGRHGYRGDRRTRIGVDVDRRRGLRSGDVGVRRSYGYTAGNCQEILRRYRQCVAR